MTDEIYWLVHNMTRFDWDRLNQDDIEKLIKATYDEIMVEVSKIINDDGYDGGYDCRTEAKD